MKSKFAISFVCAALWLYFVLTGKSSADSFVDFLKQVLVGVGVYHAALTDPKTPTQDAVDKKIELDSLQPKDPP